MEITVALLSGRSFSLRAAPDLRIGEVQAAAEEHFGLRLRLTLAGEALEAHLALRDAGLQDGDTLMATVQSAFGIAATHSAFALWRYGGGAITWGNPRAGGDSKRVQDQLKNVRHIQATEAAFAALL